MLSRPPFQTTSVSRWLTGWLITVFLTLILLPGCHSRISSANLPERDSLIATIARNITVPETATDTLTYFMTGVCGNAEPEEIARHFEPDLLREPFGTILQQHTRRSIQYAHVLDSIIFMQEIAQPDAELAPGYDMNRFTSISVSGHVKDDQTVKIHETYARGGQSVMMEKIYSFDGDHWTCKPSGDNRREEPGNSE